MATTRTNADRILALIFDAGGSISGADLRAALDDLDQPERAKAVGLLRSEGKIRSEGSTLQIRYHLVDWKDAPAERAERPTLVAVHSPATSHPLPQAAEDETAPAGLSLELQFMACLEQLADDPEFAMLSDDAKIRGAHWLASRLRRDA